MSLVVVPAVAADYATFARLFPELAVPDPTPSEERFVETIVPRAIFVREGDVTLGYAWWRRRADKLHVVHVITDPAHRRRGVGLVIMDALRACGRAEGFTRWMLNVKPENTAARALYERCGMRITLESVSMRVAWSDVDRMPLVPAHSREIPAAHDARFEEALGMPRGELASYRALAGRMILGTEDASGPAGALAFDPAFPGASPFRVRAPEHARALLDAVRPHATKDHTFVFVEGDPALEAAFTDAGAGVAMRALRMEGEL